LTTFQTLCRGIALLNLIVMMVACEPGLPTKAPIPSLQSLRLAFSPDSRPAQLALEQCADAQPGLALLADEIPVTAMHNSGTELWLRIGVPDNWGGYAAQLAEERIVVLVNPDNQARSLSLEEIRSIFSGQVQSWSQVGGTDQSIQVWVLPPEDEASQIVNVSLLANQGISDQAFLAASPERMLQAIADDPGAIGYLPQAWTDSTVRIITLPSDLQSSLVKPLLALSTSEPEGQTREFLICLQHGNGQQALKARYYH
jgi:hypothetical protein